MGPRLGRAARRALRGHEGGVTSVALGTLDGRPVVVSGGDDGTVRVWDEGGAVLSVRIGSSVMALAFAKLEVVAVAADRGLLLLVSKRKQSHFLWQAADRELWIRLTALDGD